MKWVTREKPRTDRIACPWLIRAFIDPDAEILYVPRDEVLAVAERERAISFDAPGARYTHRDGMCSFEVLVDDYQIADPAVALMASIIHGADVAEDVSTTPSVGRPARDRRWLRLAGRRRSPPARARAARLRRPLRLVQDRGLGRPCVMAAWRARAADGSVAICPYQGP
jgi:hypothetical protein